MIIKEAIDKGQKSIKPLILFSSRNFNSVLSNDDIKELKLLLAKISWMKDKIQKENIEMNILRIYGCWAVYIWRCYASPGEEGCVALQRRHLVNAFVHNHWTNLNSPMFCAYSNLVEILSHGALAPQADCWRDSLTASPLVKPELLTNFLQFHISERTGREGRKSSTLTAMWVFPKKLIEIVLTDSVGKWQVCLSITIWNIIVSFVPFLVFEAKMDFD